MSPKEGVFYAAWMAGIIITVPICRSLGVHHLIGLAIGVFVGAGLGFVAEQIYTSARAKAKGDGGPATGRPSMKRDVVEGEVIDSASNTNGAATVACRNRRCDWSGDPRFNAICPKCGQRIAK